MKIRELNVTPIAISDPPLRNAAGLHAPYALRIVVELVSEDGISGISEIPGSEDTRQALLSAAEVVVVIWPDPDGRDTVNTACRAIVARIVGWRKEEVTKIFGGAHFEARTLRHERAGIAQPIIWTKLSFFLT